MKSTITILLVLLALLVIAASVFGLLWLDGKYSIFKTIAASELTQSLMTDVVIPVDTVLQWPETVLLAVIVVIVVAALLLSRILSEFLCLGSEHVLDEKV